MSDTTPKRYRVIKPMVNVRVAGNMFPNARGRASAWTQFGYYENAVLPTDVHPDDIERLLAEGFLEVVDG
ncbi:hypothetical protein [Micromonospora coerulea]|uniref:hypothetical protein n=1 Tax=Micromonospora coerulea TaxID=47856 RepID=UPI001907EE38|nr:hypothetical protein [Micromonospora veneta]